LTSVGRRHDEREITTLRMVAGALLGPATAQTTEAAKLTVEESEQYGPYLAAADGRRSICSPPISRAAATKPRKATAMTLRAGMAAAHDAASRRRASRRTSR
jgi:hypothetical protein